MKGARRSEFILYASVRGGIAQGNCWNHISFICATHKGTGFCMELRWITN